MQKYNVYGIKKCMNKQRKCVGCGELKPREDLIRVMKTDKKELIVNPNSKTFGRSAYLCYNQSCIELALKKSKINKALKTNATLDKATLLDLLKKEK